MLFIQFPINQINRVMTGGESWAKEGLGRTGDVYLIGPDKRMRSRSRLLWEDPTGFYNKLETNGYSPEDIARVRRAGTATLAQRVDTASAEQALSGHEGAGVSKNYLGEQVLTSYAPLDIPGLHWAIFAEMRDRPEIWGIMTIGIGPVGYVAGWGSTDGMDAAFGWDGD